MPCQVFEYSTNELFIAFPTTAATTMKIKIYRATGTVSYWLILKALNNTT